MRKLFIISVLLATVVLAMPSVEAKASANAVQERVAYLGPPVAQYQRRGRRVVTRTRVRWIGRYRYRETIRTVYLRNGQTRTTIIRRVRLAGRRW